MWVLPSCPGEVTWVRGKRGPSAELMRGWMELVTPLMWEQGKGGALDVPRALVSAEIPDVNQGGTGAGVGAGMGWKWGSE